MQPYSSTRSGAIGGFTLIELSIVLVVIALIIGSILVGQDLIAAAAVRAQVAQIEKYRTAVNTFRGKYNAQLPGDMDAQDASMFGFAPRVPASGSYVGLGDGNGIIVGYADGYSGGTNAAPARGGEVLMFWQDLSVAGLMDGTFNSLANTQSQAVLTNPISQYLPAARIGNGNYIYVWSGGYPLADGGSAVSNGVNYFGLSVITSMDINWGRPGGNPGLTVAQANAIDVKSDDGLPQYGYVLALYTGGNGGYVHWASSLSYGNGANTWFETGFGDAERSPYVLAGPVTASDGVHTPAVAGSCYDNRGIGGVEKYSIDYQSGSNINCALSFQFQ